MIVRGRCEKQSDETISVSGKDCFAEFILIVRGLAVTRSLGSPDSPLDRCYTFCDRLYVIPNLTEVRHIRVGH